EHAAYQHHEKTTDCEVFEAEELQIDQRFFLTPLPDDEPDHAGDEDQSEDPDEVGGKPIVFFALIEHDLHAAHREGQEGQPHVVHVAKFGSIRLDPWWIFNKTCNEDKGQDTDRDIDEEDPAP